MSASEPPAAHTLMRASASMMLRSQRLFGDNAAMTPAATSVVVPYLEAIRLAILRAVAYQSTPYCTSCDVASVNLATTSLALTLN